MNTHAPLTMDKATFLRWTEGQERKFELKDGVAMMMARVSRDHMRVTIGFTNEFLKRLDLTSWEVGVGEFAVEIGEDIRCPDVIVERVAPDGKSLSTTKPVIIVEVLSPSSIGIDMHVKAVEYMSLASLETYIVASQDEPRLWIWNRSTETDRAWPKVPDEVHGKDKAVPLPCLGVELPMAEIYAALPD
jgi:Uma2 family endonuclease